MRSWWNFRNTDDTDWMDTKDFVFRSHSTTVMKHDEITNRLCSKLYDDDKPSAFGGQAPEHSNRGFT